MSVYEVIKKHINKLDYMGFLKMGAPDDEYDVETDLIILRIGVSPNEDTIANAICDVFSSMFNAELESYEFLSCARDIYLELKINNLLNKNTIKQ